MESLTEKFNQSISINADDLEKYHRYMRQGKDAAQQGELERSLELFLLAYDLQPSGKLQNRIQRLQEAIQELAASEEEDGFVDVNDSGLMLYKGLYDKLYDYQKEGVAFLYSLHRDRRKGGILADDMGLGKTIQVISFLSGMYDAELASRTLLIMPTSLIKNWVQEFAKWTPGMRVKEFHGISKVERNRNLERVQHKGGVVITTYQMLINNWELLASLSGRQEFCWDYVILDEAHKIKTSSTKTAKCAHLIPARQRLLLTGTPVQNNLREMWALFDFACKGSLLGTAKTFKAEYENPITRAREKDATPGEKALGLKMSQNLMQLIKPYFLRRTKAEVQSRKRVMKSAGDEEEDRENRCPNADKLTEMPSWTRKNDLIVWTYLSPIQEDIYKKFISLDHIKELLMTTRSPLAELTVLKKLCDHPRLLSIRAITQLGLEACSAADHAPEEAEEQKNESAASRIEHVPDETLVEESGKLRFLMSLLEQLRKEGHRTLVFSQSRKMLDIMERVLRNRSFQILRVDGTITQLTEREKRITLFQTDRRYSVFLLTTQVGGVGLTLTAANRVVVFDPSWNPATDAQAVDRAYRIGQTENVVIYRLITCGTVEEKIYRRQVFKDSLIRQTTGDKKNPFRYFSKQELKELFTLQDTRCSSTQQQLQALHGQHRCSDPTLDHHIACLHSMEMFGISDHDLLFSREAGADVPEDTESHHYIETRVQKAQELVQAESELHGQLLESVALSTEPAWLSQARHRNREENGARAHRAPPVPNSPPPMVDLIQSSLDEKDQKVEELQELHCSGEVEIVSEERQTDASNQSSLSAGAEELSSQVVEEDVAAEISRDSRHAHNSVEVEIVDEDVETEARDQSRLSAGVMELSSQVVEEDVAAESGHVLMLGDGLDLTEESCNLGSEDLHSPPKMESLSLHPESGENRAWLADDGTSQHTSLLGQLDSSEALLEVELEASVVSVEAEQNVSVISVEVEPFQGNFNLQLEDSADMFADEAKQGEEEVVSYVDEGEEEAGPSEIEEESEEEVGLSEGEEAGSSDYEKEARLSEGNEKDEEEAGTSEGKEESGLSADEECCPLKMEVSDRRVDEADKPEKSSPCGSPARMQSSLSTPGPDSFVYLDIRKKKARVIYDSEEDEQEEQETEKPCLASSPLASGFRSSSTPKSGLTNSAPRRHSMNTSVASRRSFVESLLEDLEEEDDCSSEGTGLSHASDLNGTSFDESVEEEEEEEEAYRSSGGLCLSQVSEANGTSVESVLEEEEVNEETPSSENMGTDEGVSLEEYESEDKEEEQSALEESTGDVELASSETMEQFAPVPTPETCSESSRPFEGAGRVPQEPEETYESLVLSGKRNLAEGNKKQALDLFLKAIDIHCGDAEIQLLIIQLYREL